jgi:hypothetical protein
MVRRRSASAPEAPSGAAAGEAGREGGAERHQRVGRGGGDSARPRQGAQRGGQVAGEGEGDLPLAGIRAQEHRAGARRAQPGAHVGEEARLPDPGGAGDVYVVRAAAPRRVPGAKDGAELPLASDQLGHEPGRAGARARALRAGAARRRGGLRVGHLAREPQHDARRGLRLPVLGRQHLVERVRLDGRTQRSAAGGERLDQQPPAPLVAGIGVPHAPGEGDRLPEARGVEEPADQRVPRPQEGVAQPVPLDVRPALELRAAGGGEPREKVPPVPLHGLLVVARLDGCEEGVPVRVHHAGQSQLAAPRHHEVLAEALPEDPQRLAEGVRRRRRLQVRPEEVEDLLAAHGAAGREGEVDDEGEGLGGAERVPRRGAGIGVRERPAAQCRQEQPRSVRDGGWGAGVHRAEKLRRAGTRSQGALDGPAPHAGPLFARRWGMPRPRSVCIFPRSPHHAHSSGDRECAGFRWPASCSPLPS